LLGALLFALGCASTAFSICAAYGRSPRSWCFAVLAPLCLLLALAGLLLVFVPGFFG
jgi:hypothetical protein